MMRAIFRAIAIGCILLGGTARAQEITLESAPPVVVRTVPEAGAGNVDPGTKEIRVTFSRPMQDGSWSWSTASKETFPQTTGKPRYLEERRTGVLPVKMGRGGRRRSG